MQAYFARNIRPRGFSLSHCNSLRVFISRPEARGRGSRARCRRPGSQRAPHEGRAADQAAAGDGAGGRGAAAPSQRGVRPEASGRRDRRRRARRAGLVRAGGCRPRAGALPAGQAGSAGRHDPEPCAECRPPGLDLGNRIMDGNARLWAVSVKDARTVACASLGREESQCYG